MHKIFIQMSTVEVNLEERNNMDDKKKAALVTVAALFGAFLAFYLYYRVPMGKPTHESSNREVVHMYKSTMDSMLFELECFRNHANEMRYFAGVTDCITDTGDYDYRSKVLSTEAFLNLKEYHDK